MLYVYVYLLTVFPIIWLRLFPSYSPVRSVHRRLNTRTYTPLYSYMHCVDVSYGISFGRPF
jgi:hypothetical protein